MKKNYIYTLVLTVLLACGVAAAQDHKQESITQESSSIEGLNLYPNPVTNGKVNISTKNDSEKEITIFNVLGKIVLQTNLHSRELSVANLSPGVYIIKISEGGATNSRKLIIR